MASLIDSQRSGSFGLAKLGDGVCANSDAKTQAGLGRGPNQSKKLVNAAWTNTFPAQGATLDLDFANDRGYVRGVGQGRSMDAVTFTRASNGTFVKPDGTLSQYSNQGALGLNLLTFPQNFENAVWTKDGASVVLNTISAPDGTNTASLLLESSANSQHRIFQLPTGLGISGVRSIYAKSRGNNRFLFIEDSGASAWFNIENGTLGTVNAGGTATITSVGDGWYRCTLKGDSTGSIYAIYGLSNADNVKSYVGDGTSGLFIWGAQLELGSTATQYFPTNINTPRFDWASTVQLANTNLLQFTEQFNNGYWTLTNGAVTANSMITTDPLGGNTADLYLPASSGNFRAVQRGTTVASLNIKTISVYAKAGGINWLSIRDNTTAWAWFDLQNGVLGTVTFGYTASITPVGNGWYRCVATFTSGVVTFPTFMLSDANNGDFVTATGLTGVYIWGAQGETGTSVTDYQAIAQPTTNTPLLANPTSNGLLIEESRTNRILWCRDATQTNWTKTNVTVAKTQTGIDGVANSASLLTASSANGTCIQPIVLASGSRTGSVYLKRITGTGTIQVTLDGTTYSTVDLSTSEWRRIVLSGTVTNPTVGIRIVTSGDAVAMDFGQVEDGGFVTSPILTTTASVTRSADIATVPISATWYNPNAQTVCSSIKFTNYVSNVGFSGGIVGFGIGSPRILIQKGAAIDRPYSYQIFDGTRVMSGKGADFNDSANGVTHKIALSYDIANSQMSVDGISGLFQYVATVGTPNVGLNMQIGNRPDTTSLLNGWISQLTIYPKRLNTTTIDLITGSSR